MEVVFNGEIRRLELRPGDRFVMTVPERLMMDQAESIRDAWRRLWGGDHVPLVVLDAGIRLEVLTADSAQTGDGAGGNIRP
jgi:hypothetical protein